MTPPLTRRDAAAVQRLWTNRELSDADVDRALAELGQIVDQRDRAADVLRRLAAAWAPLKAAVAETDDEAARLRRKAERALEH